MLGSVAFSVSNDGDTGSESTGQNFIQALVPKLIITGIHVDFDFGTYPGTGSIEQDRDINIAMNYVGTYSVIATGDGIGGAFTITDGTQVIPYSVFFNDQTGTSGRFELLSGVPVTALTGGVTPLSNSTPNANTSVLVGEADIQSADAGVYEGHVIITVSPE